MPAALIQFACIVPLFSLSHTALHCTPKDSSPATKGTNQTQPTHVLRALWHFPLLQQSMAGIHVGLARTIYIRCIGIRYFWRGNHQIYGHTRCICTLLSSPTYTVVRKIKRTLILFQPTHVPHTCIVPFPFSVQQSLAGMTDVKGSAAKGGKKLKFSAGKLLLLQVWKNAGMEECRYGSCFSCRYRRMQVWNAGMQVAPPAGMEWAHRRFKKQSMDKITSSLESLSPSDPLQIHFTSNPLQTTSLQIHFSPLHFRSTADPFHIQIHCGASDPLQIHFTLDPL